MKISVVTPFYNTAAYLAECIESVLAQTRGDYEYILVDNHSTDGGADIAARYAAKDSRLRVLRPPVFLAQVPNYNFALAQVAAEARFVKMVQADDTIFPTCLADMVALAEAHPSIAVVSSYRLMGEQVKPSGLSHKRTFMTGREACRVVLFDEIYMFGSPTTTLFRADVVRARRPFFVEGRYFEDTEVIFELLADHDFGFVHQVLSFTRTENDSLWGEMSSYNALLLSKRNHLAMYGRRFLTPAEFDTAWQTCDGEYHRFLADAWLRRRDEKFWEFHRKGLATVGDTIDRNRIARDAVRVAAGYVLRPLRRRE